MSRPLRRALLGAAAGAVLLVLVRTFILELSYVPSASMAPTLVAGDWVLVEKRSLSLHRGDVVVFDLRGDTYIKRIIGLPGDHLQTSGGVFSINGQPLPAMMVNETGLNDEGMPVKQALASYVILRESWEGRTWETARFRGSSPMDLMWTVPEGNLFVVGDNRDGSLDSRSRDFGMVPVAQVRGRATRILWSSGREGFRSGRWWRGL